VYDIRPGNCAGQYSYNPGGSEPARRGWPKRKPFHFGGNADHVTLGLG